MNNNQKRNILVCGGAGYIGQIFCRFLIEKNQFNVVIVDNFSTSKKEYIRNDIQYVEADVRDTNKIIDILTKYKIDCVVHFCAFSLVGESVQNPLKYYDNNVVGMIHLLEAMQQCNVKNLIFSSTAATYGQPEQQPITEETPQRPINPYGVSKLIMEQIVNTCDFIHSIAFRYFNVAGAAYDSSEKHNPETHLIPCVIKRKLQNQNCFIFGDDYPTRDGTCVRDYIHVKDLAEAHYLGIKRLFDNEKENIIHEAYNLGTKSGITVKEIVQQIDCKYEIKDRRPGDPAVLIASNEKAKQVLNWEPKETLQSIIQSAIDAHTKEYNQQ